MEVDSRIIKKFRKVHLEIESLDTKVHKKSGFLFFKSHVHTMKELLESPHHQKIFSITEKIGHDVESWYKAGRLSKSEEMTYYAERDSIDDELHRVNMSIEDREPTWWEIVKAPFTEFVEIVLHNLPKEFQRSVLVNFKRAFIPFFDKMPKFLK